MVQSLDRGIQILMILSQKKSAGITELAKHLNVDKSTVSRLVATLKNNDLLRMDPETKKYSLGFRSLQLGESIKSNLNIISVARPILMDLSAELKESVHLCGFSNNSVYVLDQVRSKKYYALSAAIGMREPLHCSSVGKCILAFRCSETIDSILENYEFVRHTENTITDEDTLKTHLNKIRTLGYAIDDEELSFGVRCIAVPVYDDKNRVRYSIGLSAPKSNINSVTIERYIRYMAEAAKRICPETVYL